MVDDDDKPFPCSSPGCSMKFANEDHLSIHKKRHSMALTIETANGAKTPTFTADETPTPTRFIRNCEEVGLFQDLQNVNPFDEQFRRAAEAATSTPTLATHRYADDVLHTPSVFPLTAETELHPLPQFHPPKSATVKRSYSNLMPTLSTSDCLLPTSPLPTLTPSIVIFPSSNSPQQSSAADLESAPKQPLNNGMNQAPPDQNALNVQKKKPGRKPVIKSNSKSMTNSSVNIMPRPATNPVSPPVSDPLQLLLRLPDGRIVQIPAIPVGNTEAEPQYQPAPATKQVNVEPSKTPLSEAKMKLKQVWTKAKSAVTAKSTPQAPSDNSGTDTDQGIITHHPSNDANKSSDSSANRRRSYQSASDPDDDEGEKRRKFLERNRAAAYRSRQKRKRWVSSLEAKTAALNNANKMLQNEVIALRGEVAQLKLQLLAHKDCPVTLAMCNQPTVDCNRDGVLIPSSTTQARNLVAINPPVAPTSQTHARQIIILNTSNTLPVVNKPISPSVVINQPPLVMMPGVIPEQLHKEPSSSLALVGTGTSARLEVPQGQETSVIISLRSNEK